MATSATTAIVVVWQMYRKEAIQKDDRAELLDKIDGLESWLVEHNGKFNCLLEKINTNYFDLTTRVLKIEQSQLYCDKHRELMGD